MKPIRRILAVLAVAAAAAAAQATPLVTMWPQTPQAHRNIEVRMWPQWGTSEMVAPYLFVVAMDRPATESVIVYGDTGPSTPPTAPRTTFDFALPEGVYQIRYYANPQAFALGQPADLVHTIVVTATGPIPVTEYYNPGLDHYFVTADPDEIRALDSGVKPGWTRTGERFFAIDGRATLGVRPVCRLYGLPSAGIDSHFLSDDPQECASAVARWPDKWVEETKAAFALPYDYAYGCDTDEYAPLFRLYNNRIDANHRYTTSLATAKQMIAAGWILEGSHERADSDLPYWSCASSGVVLGR